MTLPTPAVPPSELIEPHGLWGSLYTLEQMRSYGQQCREAALLDAINATRAFGKTGAVIAASIGVLK